MARRSALAVGVVHAPVAESPSTIGGIAASTAVGDTPRMDASDEQRAVGEVAERLAERFPDVPRDQVAQIVRDVHAALDGNPIRDFVPVLVEHDARERLRAERAGVT